MRREREESRNRNSREEKTKKGATPALALWALLAGSSILKILAVLAVMVFVEGILFFRTAWGEWGYPAGYRSLEAVVEDSRISVVFLAALGLIYLILVWTEGRLEVKSGGTMGRLRLSERESFWIRTVYNAACLTLLFAVQIWLCIWMAWVHGREAQEAGDLSWRWFLAFYRIDFLHCLLPMAEALKWVRNILLVLSFSVEAAGRAGKKEYILSILLYILAAGWFVSPLGGYVTDWLGILLYAFVSAVSLRRVYSWQAVPDRAAD